MAVEDYRELFQEKLLSSIKLANVHVYRDK